MDTKYNHSSDCQCNQSNWQSDRWLHRVFTVKARGHTVECTPPPCWNRHSVVTDEQQMSSCKWSRSILYWLLYQYSRRRAQWPYSVQSPAFTLWWRLWLTDIRNSFRSLPKFNQLFSGPPKFHENPLTARVKTLPPPACGRQWRFYGDMEGMAPRIWTCPQVVPHFSYTRPIMCHILGVVAPQVV